MTMSRIIENIKKEILSWPYVSSEPHRFGGIEFLINKREMGHIHGDKLADLPFQMDVRNKLVDSGHVSPHHVLPQSGWVSYWIKGEKIFLSLLSYLKCDMIISNQNNM